MAWICGTIFEVEKIISWKRYIDRSWFFIFGPWRSPCTKQITYRRSWTKLGHLRGWRSFLVLLLMVGFLLRTADTTSNRCPPGTSYFGVCVGGECPLDTCPPRCTCVGGRDCCTTSTLLSDLDDDSSSLSLSSDRRRILGDVICIDRAINCLLYQRFCFIAIFFKCMARNCANTCGLCGVVGARRRRVRQRNTDTGDSIFSSSDATGQAANILAALIDVLLNNNDDRSIDDSILNGIDESTDRDTNTVQTAEVSRRRVDSDVGDVVEERRRRVLSTGGQRTVAATMARQLLSLLRRRPAANNVLRVVPQFPAARRQFAATTANSSQAVKIPRRSNANNNRSHNIALFLARILNNPRLRPKQ